MRQHEKIHSSYARAIFPISIMVLGMFLPLIGNPDIDIGMNNTGDLDPEADLEFPMGDEKEDNGEGTGIEESIVLEPGYLDEYLSNNLHDFHMEDMVYGYSVTDGVYYLVLAGYTWNGPSNSTNTTWSLVFYTVDFSAGNPGLSFVSKKAPGAIDPTNLYESAFSSIEIADIDENGQPELVCGGNITYGVHTHAFYRRFAFSDSIIGMTGILGEWDNAYGVWNTTCLDIAVDDIDSDGHLELVSSCIANRDSSTSQRGLTYVYFSLDTGSTAYAYENYGFENNIQEIQWNDIAITRINHDNRSEIILGGFMKHSISSPRLAATMTLNFYGDTIYLINLKVAQPEPEIVKEIDFTGYDIGINPDGIDGWQDNSNSTFVEIKTKKMQKDHFNLMVLSDNDPIKPAILTNQFSTLQECLIEFDLSTSRLNYMRTISLLTSNDEVKATMRISNGYLEAYNASGYNFVPMYKLSPNQWMKVGMGFDPSMGLNGMFKVFIDDHAVTDWLSCYSTFNNNIAGVEFKTSGADPMNQFYIDNLRVLDKAGYESSEISALDVEDMNKDGKEDIVAIINHYSSTAGNYSSQVTFTTRMEMDSEEPFTVYPTNMDIDGRGRWTTSCDGTGSAKVQEITHVNKALFLEDRATSDLAQAWWELPGTVPNEGRISFRFMTNNSIEPTFLYLTDGAKDEASIPTLNPLGNCKILVYLGYFYVYDGASSVQPTQSCVNDAWYDISIEYDLDQGWHVIIDGFQVGSSYEYDFSGNPRVFDHFEITTSLGYGGYMSVVDEIDVSYPVEDLQVENIQDWFMEGNVNFEDLDGADGTVLTLKRNNDDARNDYTTSTKAMRMGFDETIAGSITLWAKSEIISPGIFHICDLYQGYYMTNPSIFRLFVAEDLSIRRNWTDTSSINSGYYWEDGVWHEIRVDVINLGVELNAFINVTIDGELIFHNERYEYEYERIMNVSFSLNEEFAGQLYIDNFEAKLAPERVSRDFDLKKKSPVLSALNDEGEKLSTVVQDLNASNPDDDPYSEIQIAVSYEIAGEYNPGLHKIVYKNGEFSYEGDFIDQPVTTTAQATRILLGPRMQDENSLLFLSGNYYQSGNGKHYYFLRLMANLPEKTDRGYLHEEEFGFINVFPDAAFREYTDIEIADIDQDGVNEIILLAIEYQDPFNTPMILEIYEKVGQEWRFTNEHVIVNYGGSTMYQGRDLLVKDIDNDNRDEVVVAGNLFTSSGYPYGFVWMFEYNFRRVWPNDPYFVNNKIPGNPTNHFLFTDRFQSTRDSFFTCIDAWDITRDGLDELVVGGYYLTPNEKPAMMVLSLDPLLYRMKLEIRYASFHSSIEGRINTIKCRDLDNSGTPKIIMGGNSTHFNVFNGPNNHADLRVMKVTPAFSYTPITMAVWQEYYYTGAAFSYQNYPWHLNPGYTGSLESKIMDMEIKDIDWDGIDEIVTAGSYHPNPTSSFGATHVINFTAGALNLESPAVFNDNANQDTIYNDIALGNIDYDDNVEMMVGGVSNAAGSPTIHDFMGIMNREHKYMLYPGSIEFEHIMYPDEPSFVTGIETADLDKDGVGEIVSLIGNAIMGYIMIIHNKTVIVDDTAPDIVSLNDTVNIIGTNLTLFHDDFEHGFDKWEETNGLWHITGSDSIWPDSYHSYNQSAWFGLESNGTYETGSPENGSIITMPINLAGTDQAFLEFNHWRASEVSWDYSYIYVSGAPDQPFELIYQSDVQISPWRREVFNISSYCGNESVRIKFNFDTGDAVANNYRGWLIDDVKVYTNESQFDLSVLVSDQSYVDLFCNATGVFEPVIFPDFPWGSAQVLDEPWSRIIDVSCDLQYMVPGLNFITFHAMDEFGNGKILDVPVFNDLWTPEILVSLPVDGGVFNAAPEFIINAWDDVGVLRTWYEVHVPSTNTTHGPFYFTNNGTMRGTYWDALPVEEEIYWHFYVMDWAGNIGGQVVHVFKDLDPPQVSIDYPNAFDIFSSPPTYMVEITDFSPEIFYYEVYIPSFGYSLGPVFFTSNDTMDGNVWNSIPEEEIVDWIFVAIDASGNSNYTSVPIEKDTTIADIELSYVDSPGTVIRGQENIPVEIFVENVGFNDAEITGINLTLEHFNGNFTEDISSQYSITPVLFTLPTVVSAGSGMSFNFEVDVSSYAQTGDNVTLDAQVSAHDVRTFDDVSDLNGSTNPGNWMVLKPAEVKIVGMDDTLNLPYVQGMSIDIEIAFHNFGQARATISDVDLAFSMGDIPAIGFSHDNLSPFYVRGGETVIKSIHVSIGENSDVGNITIDAVATGTEQYTNNPILAFSNKTQPFILDLSNDEQFNGILHDGIFIYTTGYYYNQTLDHEVLILCKWGPAGDLKWTREWHEGDSTIGEDITFDGKYLYIVGTVQT
ncbi:hypothetical protein GF325_08395, partial [Candidatus Bathyarchaeota archaeon]|nr:hypothetical protein [Candidatus Bathyarchaeota archaeon]